MVSEAKNKAKHEKRLKILTSKQMFQRIPIAIAQVKAINTSENLLNEICQIIQFLHPARKVTKKLYNNIVSSMKF